MNSDVAINASDLYFYYVTPKKAPLFKSIKLPLKKMVLEKNVALDHVNVQVRSRRITALLGRNGSGKTTLIKLITGVRLPHGGNISVFGLEPTQIRHRLGLCLGSTLIFHRLTARENLEYFGKLYGVHNLDNRINELAEMLELSEHLEEIVEAFSFGMKAKLAIARALIHSPDLLILDEPTLGIDLQLATQIRKFIRSLKCTVLFTSHYMEEAETLADDLVLIDKGHVLDFGDKKSVQAKYGVTTVPEVFSAAVHSHRALRAAS
ncbi:MAG: ABC transporter ATP-binding protein [Deltaproteobacteria bacterium]|nr:ABC transporter ATP-binding protein [Deltaproteobacteria bacterium]